MIFSNVNNGLSLLDIGSGGGFPGIVLKILKPEISVTLIDSSRKKVNFLSHVIRLLELENITAHHFRAQDMDKTEKFDVIICRALSSLKEFVSMALPLISQGGIIIAMKGNPDESEMDALRSIRVVMPDKTKIGYDRLEIEVEFRGIRG